MKADAIIVSDLHLTDSTPVARTDDYLQAQIRKLDFLRDLSEAHGNCPVLCGGDVFDHWKASPWLLSMAYAHLPRPFITIPGQHDLPGHSLEQYPKSALSLIEAVDPLGITVLKKEATETKDLYIVGFPFGTLGAPDVIALPPTDKRKVLMLHELTWQDKRPAWDKSGGSDRELIKQYGDYFDLIITGDNHMQFVTQDGDTLLVNAGSMLRKTADQMDHRPACYLYYAEDNSVEEVEFPIEHGVINREHIDSRERQDARIQSYVDQMRKDFEIGVSFEINLARFFRENEVTDRVKEIIYASMEEGNE